MAEPESKQNLIGGSKLPPFTASAPEVLEEVGDAAARSVFAAAAAAKAGGVAVSDAAMAGLQRAAQEGASLAVPVVRELNKLWAQILAAAPKEQAEQLAATVAAAAAQGSRSFGALAGPLRESYAAAVEAGRDLAVDPRAAGAAVAAAASTAAPAVSRALRGGMDEVKESEVVRAAARTARAGAGAVVAGGALVVRQGESFLESDAVRSLATSAVSWADDLEEIYRHTREELEVALMAAVGIVGSAIDLVKFDVIRDAYQVLALVMAGIVTGAMDKAKAVWGNLSGLVALDLNFVVPDIPAQVVYIILAILGLILLIFLAWVACVAASLNTDAIREGHEAKGWRQKMRERKKTILAIKYTLMGCITVYLPLSRSAFQILACESNLSKSLSELDSNLKCTKDADTGVWSCECSDWDLYGLFQGIAIFILLFFTLGLPLYTMWLIRRNKPTGSPEDPSKRYNEDGELVDYTDDMYFQDVTHNLDQVACPYSFLYKGYERRWSSYKVWVMVMKLLVVLPVVFLFEKQVAQALVTLLILIVFAAMSMFTTPFVNPHADVMDISGRVLFGLISLNDVAPDSETAMGVLINIAQAINVTILIVFSLAGISAIRRRFKKLLGRMTVNDTVRDFESTPDKVMPFWNVYKEVKYRIWHPMFNTLLLNACGADVAERLVELQEAVSKFGKHRVLEHFQGLKDGEISRWRKYAEEQLEGVDVYFDGVPHDGKLDSKTKFGKMYINPFPWNATFVADDSDDVAFIWNDQFLDFARKNALPEIEAKRRIRHQLRALQGCKVHLEHEQWETHRVEDGTESYTDNEGNTRTRTRYSNVQVLMHYHNGTLNVAANKKQRMAAGFKPTIHYTDGHGVAVAPNTGKHHDIRNSTTISGETMGVLTSFEMNPRLRELLEDPGNRPQWVANLPKVLEESAAYRNELKDERLAKEKVLSNGFWLYVYANMDLTKESLVQYLREKETNPVLHKLPEEHADGIEYLYKRLSFVRSHPCAMLWYTTWDSIWECNKNIEVFKAAAQHLDPQCSSSIAYRPMPRDRFEEWIKSTPELEALRQEKKWINNNFVELLFDLMRIYDESAKAGRGVTATTGDRPLSAAELGEKYSTDKRRRCRCMGRGAAEDQ